MTLGAASNQLGGIEQWLPVDGDPTASLGDLVSRNSTGPLRLGYGAWRDLLLGVQFRNGLGELITAGGMTVKNVAGYDLTKLMVGQHGVFGRIVTLTTRTYRRPAGAIIAEYSPDPDLAARLMPTPLRPQWMVVVREANFCGYLGDEETLDWVEANLPQTSPRRIARRAFEDDVRHRATLWKHIGEHSFRASVPPARLLEFTSVLPPTDWAADPAFGIVIGPAGDEQSRVTLRGRAEDIGGSVTFTLSGGVAFDASTNPIERQIIERLKNAFDPDGRLNPLPWQQTH